MGYIIGRKISFPNYLPNGVYTRLTGEIVSVGEPNKSGTVLLQVKVGDKMYDLRLPDTKDTEKVRGEER